MSDNSTPTRDRYGRAPWEPGTLDRIAWLTSKLRGKAKVLGALTWFAGTPDHIARPGMDLLRKAVDGMDPRAIQRYLRQLQKDGSIVPVAHLKGGRGNATEYRVVYERAVVPTVLLLAQRAVDSTQKGGRFDTKGRYVLPPLPEEPEENPSSSSGAVGCGPEEEDEKLSWTERVEAAATRHPNCGPEFTKWAKLMKDRRPSTLEMTAAKWDEPEPKPPAASAVAKEWRCNGCGEIAEHASGGLCQRCHSNFKRGRT